MRVWLLCGACLFLVSGIQDRGPLSPDALAYLNAALDVMQQNFLHRDRIDWRGLKRASSGAEAKLPVSVAIPDAACSRGGPRSGDDAADRADRIMPRLPRITDRPLMTARGSGGGFLSGMPGIVPASSSAESTNTMPATSPG